jgi:hypothetical protein
LAVIGGTAAHDGSLTMSGDTGRAFDPRIIGALIVAGMVGFVGYWLLTAFSPELGTGRNGGGHALSRSAVSYSAMVRIAEAAGRDVTIGRTTSRPDDQVADQDQAGLLVLTPELGTSAEDFAAALALYDHGDVLVVLPKWFTEPDPDRRGWVRRRGALDEIMPMMRFLPEIGSPRLFDGDSRVTGVAGVAHDQAFQLRVPRRDPRVLAGDRITPVAGLGNGALVGVLPQEPDSERHIFILADPDILNNQGLTSPERAQAALSMLDAMGAEGGLTFDVTLNGLGGGRSLLRLAFTPPFLGLTLCLGFAALLGLWQGFVRFGPPWRESRAVALGKAALVANSAALIVQARRVPHFAARYAAMVREAAARRLHAPSGLAGPALDRWLDRFTDSRGQKFSPLVAALESAQNPQDCIASAAALGQWRKDIVRDSD